MAEQKEKEISKEESKLEDSKVAKKSKHQGKFRKGKKFNKPKPVNDPSWYIVDEAITKQVGNVPFNVFSGIAYSITKPNRGKQSKLNIPGVATFKYIPVLNTNAPGRAVDLTAKALYQYIRRMTSGGAKVYQSSDVLMYILAMDSIYLAVHQIKRVLRIFNSYRMKNRLIPRAILRTLGIGESERYEYANLVARLNLSISRVNSIAVPKDFNLFKRRAVLGSVILTDEVDEPTQIVIPNADIVYAYYSAQPTGGSLVGFDLFRDTLDPDDTVIPEFNTVTVDYKTNRVNQPKGSIDLALKNLEAMLDRVLFDDDMSIIGGDIQRAYEGNLHQIPYLEVNETIEYTYDPDLWQQFKASTVLDVPGASVSLISNPTKGSGLSFQDGSGSATSIQPIMYQDNNTFICSPVLTSNNWNSWQAAAIWCTDNYTHFILSTDEEVSPAKVVEWTRLMSYIDTDIQFNNRDLTAVVSGTELGLGWLVYVEHNNNTDTYFLEQWMQFGNEWPADETHDYVTSSTSSQTSIGFTIIDEQSYNYRVASKSGALNFMNGLRHRPRLYGITRMQTQSAAVTQGECVTIAGRSEKNTSIIPKSQLNILHDTAMYGLLANPQFSLRK